MVWAFWGRGCGNPGMGRCAICMAQRGMGVCNTFNPQFPPGFPRPFPPAAPVVHEGLWRTRCGRLDPSPESERRGPRPCRPGWCRRVPNHEWKRHSVRARGFERRSARQHHQWSDRFRLPGPGAGHHQRLHPIARAIDPDARESRDGFPASPAWTTPKAADRYPLFTIPKPARLSPPIPPAFSAFSNPCSRRTRVAMPDLRPDRQ
jgi:hypothetical protein